MEETFCSLLPFSTFFNAIKRAKKRDEKEKREEKSFLRAAAAVAASSVWKDGKINYSPLNRPPKNVIYHFESASTKRKEHW